MTAEERRKLLQERYGLDDKKSKVQNSEEDIVSDATSEENVDEDTKKKSSAGKKVLIGTLAAAAVLGAGAGKAKYDQYQNKADERIYGELHKSGDAKRPYTRQSDFRSDIRWFQRDR